MITTLSAMQVSRFKSFIIGLTLLLLGPLLAGCSSLRMGYANGPLLGWWWIDGYLDFTREQTPQVKQVLERWFDWHRSTQLAEYARVLSQLRAQVLEPTTAAAACAWPQRVRNQLDPALARALGEFADVLPGLGEVQFRYLEQRYAKQNEELRANFLQADASERQRAALRRTLERAERFYGPLEPAQRQLVSAGALASPFNAELWMTERQRRQRDTLQTLRRLAADKSDKAQRLMALQALVQRSERSPSPEYEAYQARLAEHNCALGTRVHNAATPAQRQKAHDTIKAWEDDFRALLVPAGG